MIQEASPLLTDEDIVRRVIEGETALFEQLIRRHNQRLYRAIRAILKDEAETEDAMQEAYVRAFSHLDQFAGNAMVSTWLTKIAVYEALGRVRRRKRMEGMPKTVSPTLDPESIRTAGNCMPRSNRQLIRFLRCIEAFSSCVILKS